MASFNSFFVCLPEGNPQRAMEEPGLPAAPNSGLGSGPWIRTRQESADASAVIGWCLAEWPAVAVEPWGCLTNQHPEDPNGAAMVTWIPSINPSHVSIFLPAPWIRHGTWDKTKHVASCGASGCKRSLIRGDFRGKV